MELNVFAITRPGTTVKLHLSARQRRFFSSIGYLSWFLWCSTIDFTFTTLHHFFKTSFVRLQNVMCVLNARSYTLQRQSAQEKSLRTAIKNVTWGTNLITREKRCWVSINALRVSQSASLLSPISSRSACEACLMARLSVVVKPMISRLHVQARRSSSHPVRTAVVLRRSLHHLVKSGCVACSALMMNTKRNISPE